MRISRTNGTLRPQGDVTHFQRSPRTHRRSPEGPNGGAAQRDRRPDRDEEQQRAGRQGTDDEGSATEEEDLAQRECVMEKVFPWTTPEDAVAEEVRYWASVSPSERVAAVEMLRQRTPGIYGDAPSRLERVYRFVERQERPVPDRRRARARR
jgi:hypothetical protein